MTPCVLEYECTKCEYKHVRSRHFHRVKGTGGGGGGGGNLEFGAVPGRAAYLGPHEDRMRRSTWLVFYTFVDAFDDSAFKCM